MSVLWCQGMFASGSTWLYNVARAVAAELEPGCAVQGRFVFAAGDLAGLRPGGGETRQIVKSHQTIDGVLECAWQSDAILVTLRDPRDAVVSLMQYSRFPFHRALFNVCRAAEACYRLGSSPRAVTLHYESGFIDDPATIDGVARHLGGRLAVERRDAIFAATRRPAIEAFIATLEDLPGTVEDQDGDVYDLSSHWHRHHAGRTGESGRWRQLLYPAQITGIETNLRDWMMLFGYRPAHAWGDRPAIAPWLRAPSGEGAAGDYAAASA